MKLFVIVLALALTACTPPETSGIKAIVGAKLIPAPNRPPIEYSVVIIENGKFREVGPQSAIPVPKGAEITRGNGSTIESVPGGGPIEAGQSADLLLEGATKREMRHGDWVN